MGKGLQEDFSKRLWVIGEAFLLHGKGWEYSEILREKGESYTKLHDNYGHSISSTFRMDWLAGILRPLYRHLLSCTYI